MSKSTRRSAAAAAGIFILSIASPAAAGDLCADSWAANVQPIVNAYCVACHQNAAPASELSLQRGSAPANLIGVKSVESELALVTPGDPSQSYLFRKLEGTHLEAGGAGERMPLGGTLTETDLATIKKWIEECEG